MKKNAIAKILVNTFGFKKRGVFYIGTCNDSVIAGYGLDEAPSATYVWRFALPTYDDVEFLHFSLGKRILHLPKDDDGNADISDLLRRDWSDFSKVNDCASLMKYLDEERVEGTYALWTRYLTHIRCRDFDAAERLYSDASVVKKLSELRAISKNFADLSEAKNREDWEGCFALLDGWRRKAKATFC